MGNYLFIDENVHILTDDDAKQALARRNDAEFLVPGQGIMRVSESRWLAAQNAEKRHWTQLGVGADNDRNYEHLVAFDRYRTLRGCTFESSIELGCGPFTNLRLIADVCRVKSCDLLDPLVRDYLSHPNCSYSRGFLRVDRTRMPYRVRTLLRRLAKRTGPGFAAKTFSGAVSIRNFLPMPIEHLAARDKYDLVVMINVIEHCYDIEKVLRNVIRALMPGGILVMHDKYYDAATVELRVKACFDAAHPLQVDRSVIDGFLDKHFVPMFTKSHHVAADFLGCDVSSDYFYFIGRKC